MQLTSRELSGFRSQGASPTKLQIDDSKALFKNANSLLSKFNWNPGVNPLVASIDSTGKKKFFFGSDKNSHRSSAADLAVTCCSSRRELERDLQRIVSKESPRTILSSERSPRIIFSSERSPRLIGEIPIKQRGSKASLMTERLGQENSKQFKSDIAKKKIEYFTGSARNFIQSALKLKKLVESQRSNEALYSVNIFQIDLDNMEKAIKHLESEAEILTSQAPLMNGRAHESGVGSILDSLRKENDELQSKMLKNNHTAQNTRKNFDLAKRYEEEIHILKERADKAERQLFKQERKCQDRKECIQKLYNLVEEKEQEKEEVQERHEVLQRQLQILKQQANEREAQIDKLENQLLDTQQLNTELHLQRNPKQESMEELRSSIIDSQIKLQVQCREDDPSILARWRTIRDALTDRQKIVSLQKEELETEQKNLREELLREKERVRSLEERITGYITQIKKEAQRERELDECQLQWERRLQQCSEEWEKQIEERESALAQQKKEAEIVARQLVQSERRRVEAEGRIEAKIAEQEMREQEFDDLNEQIRALDAKYAETKKALSKTQEDLKDALEQRQQMQLNSINDASNAKKQIEGKKTELIESKNAIKIKEPAYQTSKAEVVEARNAIQSMKLESLKINLKVQQQEDEIVVAKKLIKVQSNQLEERQKQLEEARGARDASEEQLKRREKELLNELKAVANQLAVALKESSQAKAQIDDIKEELEITSTLNKEKEFFIEQQYSKAKDSLAEKQVQIEQLINTTLMLEDELLQAGEIGDKLRKEVAMLNNQINSLHSTNAQLQSIVESLNKNNTKPKDILHTEAFLQAQRVEMNRIVLQKEGECLKLSRILMESETAADNIRRALEDAERQNEFQNMKLQDQLARIASLEDQLNTASDKIKKAADLERRNALEQINLKDSNSMVKNQFDNLQSELQRERRANADAKALNDDLLQKSKIQKRETVQLTQQLNEFKSQHSKIEQRNQQVNASKETLSRENLKLKEQKVQSEMQLQKLQNTNDRITERIIKIEDENKELKKNKFTLEEETADMKEQLRQQKAESQQLISQQDKTIERLKSSLESLSNSKKAKLDLVGERGDTHYQELLKAQEELEKQIRDNKQLSDGLAASEAKLLAVQKKSQYLEEENEAQKKSISQEIADKLKSEHQSKDLTAQCAALSEKEKAQREELTKLRESLLVLSKEKNQLEIELDILNSVKEAKEVERDLEMTEMTKELPRPTRHFEEKKADSAHLLQTDEEFVFVEMNRPKGEVEVKGQMEVSVIDSQDNAENTKQSNKIEKLQLSLSEMTQQLNKKTQEIEQSALKQHQLDQLITDMSQKQMESKALIEELNAKQQREIAQVKEECNVIRDQYLRESELKQVNYELKIRELSEKNKQLQVTIEQLEKQLIDQSKERQANGSEQQNQQLLKETTQTLQIVQHEFEVEKKNHQEQIQNLEEKIRLNEREFEEMKEEMARKQNEVQKETNELTETIKSQAELIENYKNMQKQKNTNEREEQKKQNAEERESLKNQITILDSEKNKLQKSIDNLQKENASAQKDIHDLEERIKAMEEEIKLGERQYDQQAETLRTLQDKMESDAGYVEHLEAEMREQKQLCEQLEGNLENKRKQMERQDDAYHEIENRLSKELQSKREYISILESTHKNKQELATMQNQQKLKELTEEVSYLKSQLELSKTQCQALENQKRQNKEQQQIIKGINQEKERLEMELQQLEDDLHYSKLGQQDLSIKVEVLQMKTKNYFPLLAKILLAIDPHLNRDDNNEEDKLNPQSHSLEDLLSLGLTLAKSLKQYRRQDEEILEIQYTLQQNLLYSNLLEKLINKVTDAPKFSAEDLACDALNPPLSSQFMLFNKKVKSFVSSFTARNIQENNDSANVASS